MATGGDADRLTPQQIVFLASAISAKNMAVIAEGYMDIDDVTIKNLQYENKDDAKAFNREVIRTWANRIPENQVQVMIRCPSGPGGWGIFV